MTYEETINYLFNAAPLFQNVGGKAYKEGLSNTHLLDKHFEHPHKKYITIHVAGTNGKGSCAHTLAAMLQHKGLQVGLYTSPHLIDFRERIRVNGEPISKQYVIDFIGNEKYFFEPLHPSFFEITTAMAFKYFADKHVDVAVIEVGLGGRLDCTNIIMPCLSIITNISFDHTQFLGNTLAQIASEKAGIIKNNIPVIIGETTNETRPVFQKKALELNAPIHFAEETQQIKDSFIGKDNLRHYITKDWGELTGELIGECQIKNTNTLLCAYNVLKPIFNLDFNDISYALQHVCELTGLQGRWQILQKKPMVVCDAGHNMGGWQYISHQLKEISEQYKQLHIVFGMANDKDVDHVMQLLPANATFYWTRASVHRAMNEHDVEGIGKLHHLRGLTFNSVSSAYDAALSKATPNDFVYIGGSCFVIADLLRYLQTEKK